MEYTLGFSRAYTSIAGQGTFEPKNKDRQMPSSIFRKVQKHFLTRYTVKNGISNLYILLKSVLKMQEMLFLRPAFQNGISNLYILLKSALKMQEMPFQRPKFPDPPTIVSSLWPPPH